ncbi:enoyl-CoA hydratase/isomerase family protein [Tomitella cavernea]|uniref:Enoyl-CoA hydratase/isomerase family protein n=1 Tax=Tomitella cavernea TaxID=1387982 RepID=A0ABP9C5U2_9ACTN|nr:enoyl-CoA hydratase/isomerase family protein [Tomitella cavernea]
MKAAVTLSVEQNLARVTINNPQHANSLTRPMLTELREHIATVATAPRIRAVIVTGAGANFCAGLDITGIRAGAPDSIEHDYVAVEKALAECPKPTIAAIRGHCIGGGTQLAVACDLRIAADTARFAIAPAKLGLVYPPDPIAASTALHYGLITDVCADTELDDVACRMATVIATRSPVTIAAAKQMIDDVTAHGAIREEVRSHWRRTHNADLPVGLAAFAAKTAPDFADPAE